MKNITKLLVIATVAALSATAAFADDQQLQNRLALQTHDAEHTQQSTTVAVYAGDRGFGQRGAIHDEGPESRFEWRTNAKGQGFGIYVPVK